MLVGVVHAQRSSHPICIERGTAIHDALIYAAVRRRLPNFMWLQKSLFIMPNCHCGRRRRWSFNAFPDLDRRHWMQVRQEWLPDTGGDLEALSHPPCGCCTTLFGPFVVSQPIGVVAAVYGIDV